jgi:hypothetical protein
MGQRDAARHTVQIFLIRRFFESIVSVIGKKGEAKKGKRKEIINAGGLLSHIKNEPRVKRGAKYEIASSLRSSQ